MRSRSVLLALLVSIVLLASTATVAADEPKHSHHDHVSDENLRNVFLIGTPGAKAQSNSTQRPGTAATYGGLGLSGNISDTTESSRAYNVQQDPLYGCLGACVQPSKAVRIGAAYTGSDFEVEHQDAYDGVIHFAWSFRSTTPVTLQPSTVGIVIVSLQVAGEDYGQAYHYLRGPSGDVTLPVSFMHGHDCADGQRHVHNGSGCHEPGNQSSVPDNQTLGPVYAKDFQLSVVIQPANDWTRQPLGGQLMVKFDTGGGSWIQVREVPPPPPEPIEVEASSQEIRLEARHEDVNGDGEVQADELEFVPGPSPVLILATLGLLGVAIRRLRG